MGGGGGGGGGNGTLIRINFMLGTLYVLRKIFVPKFPPNKFCNNSKPSIFIIKYLPVCLLPCTKAAY